LFSFSPPKCWLTGAKSWLSEPRNVDRYNIPTEVVFFYTNYCRDSRLLNPSCSNLLSRQ
jgi:hypothetical protein